MNKRKKLLLWQFKHSIPPTRKSGSGLRINLEPGGIAPVVGQTTFMRTVGIVRQARMIFKTSSARIAVRGWR